MECLVSRRRHRAWIGVWCSLSRLVFQVEGRMGHSRCDSLSFRNVVLLYRLDALSCPARVVGVERAAAQVGPCRHLLAHCGQLQSYHPDMSARRRSVGLGPLHLCLALRHRGNGEELHASAIPQQHRNLMFCGHGAVDTGGPETADRQSAAGCLLLDNRRGRRLYHRCPLLHASPPQIHAHGVSFLCALGQYLPHHRGVGHTAKIHNS